MMNATNRIEKWIKKRQLSVIERWTHADTHIPLVFMGWHIKPGKTNKLTYMVDTAPTVCSMLHIEAPSATTGNPIVEVVDQK